MLYNTIYLSEVQRKGTNMVNIMSADETKLIKKDTSPLKQDELMMLSYYFEYALAYIKQTTQVALPPTPIKDYSIN